jgi:metal-dependent amidase/aminoacylase/carboxypeptidase family protein
MGLQDSSDKNSFITPIALQSGTNTFGTSPRQAMLLLTMRANNKKALRHLMQSAQEIVSEVSQMTGAESKVSFEEYFPVTENHPHATRELQSACQDLNLPYENMESAYRWSEDFGYFGMKFPILMFGLGSGTETSPLHSPTYNFPDELIEIGGKIFGKLFDQSIRP